MDANEPMPIDLIKRMFDADQIRFTPDDVELEYLMRLGATRYGLRQEGKEDDLYLVPCGAGHEHSYSPEFAVFKLAQLARAQRELIVQYRFVTTGLLEKLERLQGKTEQSSGDAIPEKFAPPGPPFGNNFFAD